MQQLSKPEMEELFRILERAKCPYTCNNHGVFINLSWVPESVIFDMEKFINYCKECREELDNYDLLQTQYSDNMHAVQTAAKEAVVGTGGAGAGAGAGAGERTGTGGRPGISVRKEAGEQDEEMKNRKTRAASFSMKFYLLKKRLQKTNNLYNDWEDTLVPDAYD